MGCSIWCSFQTQALACFATLLANGRMRATALSQVNFASAARAFASADIDGDGDTDMIARLATGELKVARNDGGNRNRSLRVQLAGESATAARSGLRSKREREA